MSKKKKIELPPVLLTSASVADLRCLLSSIWKENDVYSRKQLKRRTYWNVLCGVVARYFEFSPFLGQAQKDGTCKEIRWIHQTSTDHLMSSKSPLDPDTPAPCSLDEACSHWLWLGLALQCKTSGHEHSLFPERWAWREQHYGFRAWASGKSLMSNWF